MKMKLLGPILPVGVLLAMVAGCHRDEASALAMPERPPAPVSVAAAVTQDVPVYIDQIGKTSARESVTIVPQVAGKIEAIHFTDGANVKKGDLLFTIDARPFKAALASAEATLAQNRAKLKFAQDEVKRMSEIKSTGALTVTEWEQKVNAAAIADAEVQWAQAEVDKAQLDVEYCEIKSPIDGRLGQRLVDPGNVVVASGPEGGTKLLTIQLLDPIYADFTVTENQLGTVRKYMASGVLPTQDPQNNLKVLVDIPGDSREVIAAMGAVSATRPATQSAPGPREGQLTFLDNAVQEGSGTVKVRATVPNADKYFWPRQFVKCRLVLTTLKDAVLVPATAPQLGQMGSYVYVVKDDSTAEIRPIKVGQRQGDLVVIESGVKPGERVITVGQMGVSPNGRVAITNAPTSQAVAEKTSGNGVAVK